jgi:hypothetical protein
MIPPIPRLADYGVSAETGFLPIELPLQCLPHPVYERWERIINNFQSLLLSKRLRPIIDRLPVIPTSHLETEPEWRRAYSILSFMAHGYIWGGEKPAEVGPRACPFVSASQALLTALSETPTTDHLSSSTSRRTSVRSSSGHLQRLMLVELQTHLPFRRPNTR